LDETRAGVVNVKNIDTDNYKYIEIPFVSRKEYDPEKCASGKYYITMVFSSGARGNLFEGAVESTLCIDDVELITE
jgi:hypothetical protein